MHNAAMLKYVIKPSNRIVKIYPRKLLVVIDPFFFTIGNYNIRVFILLHELAHLKTMDEHEADYLAFDLYRQSGYPLRDCIFALSRVLPVPKNYNRVKCLFERIRHEYPAMAD